MKRFFPRILIIFKSSILFLPLLALLAIITVSVLSPEKNGYSIAGYSLLSVQSNSMSPTLEAGDLILTRPVDVASLQEGDVVTFYSPDPARSGEKVTHRIDHFTKIGSIKAFVSKGDASSSCDLYPVPVDQVTGVCVVRFAKVGYVITFLCSSVGYWLLIIFPLFLFLLLQLIRFFRLFFLYRSQQIEELQRQREQLNRNRLQLENTIAYYQFLNRRLEQIHPPPKQ